jgi:hypothetical protein
VKALDVLGTGIRATAKALAAAVAPAPLRKPSPEALEELRRRADVNARAAANRDEREAEMFGTSRWLRRRSHWLSRRP